MNAIDPAEMTVDRAGARAALRAQFEDAWRDGAPVFACCRRSVAAAVERVDVVELTTADPTTRVHLLRTPLEASQPGHLAGHKCCANHLADLAFDAPELLSDPARTS